MKKQIKVTLVKHAPHPHRGEYVVSQLTNTASVRVDGYSWFVGDYINGETAQSLCDNREYEVTIKTAGKE